ncbi:MAG: hypothetical protein LC808_18735, partial [Actinobacteria bacterium]|nr:hypothetical protein [Actinomycetota bacterium]
VLAQTTFGIARRDNFSTYPLLHVAAGIPFLTGQAAGTVTPPPGNEVGLSRGCVRMIWELTASPQGTV